MRSVEQFPRLPETGSNVCPLSIHRLRLAQQQEKCAVPARCDRRLPSACRDIGLLMASRIAVSALEAAGFITPSAVARARHHAPKFTSYATLDDEDPPTVLAVARLLRSLTPTLTRPMRSPLTALPRHVVQPTRTRLHYARLTQRNRKVRPKAAKWGASGREVSRNFGAIVREQHSADCRACEKCCQPARTDGSTARRMLYASAAA